MQLLLSFMSPHKEIASLTVSKWIKDTLGLSGVNKFGDFSGHLTCSAAISKVDLFALSVPDILGKDSWSNESTRKEFYHKDILSNENMFQAKAFDFRKKGSFKQRMKSRDPV